MERFPKFSERDVDLFSAQVFKSMKRVEETLKAVTYMEPDTVKKLAGAGIEMNYMKGKAWAKPRYMCLKKYDPDLPEEFDNQISAWDMAMEYGMEHLGQLSLEDTNKMMQRSKVVVDASWSSHYAGLCNTHINGVIIEAMLNGSYPVLRDYRGCGGKRFKGEDEIFNTIDALIIPHDATPKQMGEAIQAKLESFTDETYEAAIKHNAEVILKRFFDAEINAKRSVELISMSREEVRKKLKTGQNSELVLKQTKDVMENFFHAEYPVNWITD
jgi:hypothetical protein